MNMIRKDHATQLSPISIALHWSIAVIIILLLASGIYMEENQVYAVYPWHKSFGILVLLFVVLRIVWRIYNGWPESAANHASIEKITARIVHYILIIASLLMPLSGVLMSGLGGHGLHLFGLELLAVNPDPGHPGKIIPINGAIASLAHQMHGMLGSIIIVTLVLHILGALKHHMLDKDYTLKRMLGRKL